MEFRFKLSAFLTAARSVLDVLLYDYGDRYGLFTLNDRVYPQGFQQRAATQNNTVALNFYNWWVQKTGSIANDPIGGLLSKKRNLVVHRGSPPIRFTLILSDTISFHSGLVFSSLSAPAGSAGPNAIDVTTASSAAPSPTVSTPRPSVTAFFADYPTASVIDISEKYLQMLSSIILEARTRYP